ncbi:MAG: hypothetical protein LBQ84_06195 [Flavobacteriaceae bacterium]|jgi:hypothetical protein|nr:hypothetical protein [Flavobacteriaceae bacterium]
MKKLLVIFLLTIIFGCQSNTSEKYYFLDEFDAMDMGYPYGTVIHKSKETGNFDTIIIHSDIEKYGENKSYIIALQKPNKELMLDRIESSLKALYKYNSENDSNIIYFPHTYTTLEMNRQLKKDLDSLIQVTQDTINSYKIEAKRILEKESFYQKIFKNQINYYMIDKKGDSVYGPMDRKEFLKLKSQKKIKLEFGEVPFWNW